VDATLERHIAKLRSAGSELPAGNVRVDGFDAAPPEIAAMRPFFERECARIGRVFSESAPIVRGVFEVLFEMP
jgi:hypothetical protein